MQKYVVQKRKTIALILLLIVVFSLVFTTIAVAAFDVTVAATVKPFYTIEQRGDTLFLNTNMTVYLNGKRVFH